MTLPTARPLSLVTGASTGLGLDMARLLAGRGHDLVINALARERLEETAAALARDHGVEVIAAPHDLSRPDEVDALVARVQGLGRPLELLVNNAGVGQYGPWLELDPGRETEVLRLNIEALTRLTRALVPGMVANGRGIVLNVASTAAFQPGPLMAAYYASKAYVLSFSEALHHELLGTGVSVTCLCPGPTRTDFRRRAGMQESRVFTLPGVMPSEPVARAGIEGALAGRRLVIPGALNRFGTLLVRLIPRGWALPLIHAVQRARG